MRLIQFKEVCKSYKGQRVLQNFTASIPLGEGTGIMGPSGSGKTVFIRLLMGLETPDSGSIIHPEALHFSCVFQEYCLCPGLSAIQNVALVLPRGQVLPWEALFEQVGLEPDQLHKPVRELSGGQKQRVCLVRALEAPSDFVVLDEAFKGLDDARRHLAYGYVQNRLQGRTLVLVTHTQQEAELFCSHQINISYIL